MLFPFILATRSNVTMFKLSRYTDMTYSREGQIIELLITFISTTRRVVARGCKEGDRPAAPTPL